MYLVSLSAPALLDLGVRRGMAGAHASQSFNLHSGYKPGVVKVAIGDEKRKGPLHYFELRWLQDDEVVASGRAGVLSFGDLENKVD